ncbi:MAG: hypothetical protein IT462_14310 [Planctomycetes bacterium]|nr:hypothetical protein [Planctomycetota bacterium]
MNDSLYFEIDPTRLRLSCPDCGTLATDPVTLACGTRDFSLVALCGECRREWTARPQPREVLPALRRAHNLVRRWVRLLTPERALQMAPDAMPPILPHILLEIRGMLCRAITQAELAGVMCRPRSMMAE